jgi:hypothetical protein
MKNVGCKDGAGEGLIFGIDRVGEEGGHLYCGLLTPKMTASCSLDLRLFERVGLDGGRGRDAGGEMKCGVVLVETRARRRGSVNSRYAT